MKLKKLQNIALLVVIPIILLVFIFLLKFLHPSEVSALTFTIRFMPTVWLGMLVMWVLLQLFERYLPISVTQTLSGKLIYHFSALFLLRLLMQILQLSPTTIIQPARLIMQWGLVPLLIIVYVLFFHLLFHMQQSMAIKSDMLQAKLRNLKMQSNPHFMLNTLNLLHHELQNSPQKAADLLLDLAELLRKNLTMAEQDNVPLFQEIEVSEGFLFLQYQRFGTRLNYHIEIEPDCLNAQVPALLLQPLIENAVKYAVIPYTRPGEISLHAKRSTSQDRLHITIIDNGPGFNWDKVKKGTGLTVFTQSLELNYAQKYQLNTRKTPSQFIIELDLPFIMASHIKIGEQNQ